MMKNKLLIGMLLAFVLTLGGCVKSGQDSGTTVVEAYFEFMGPHSKWAGPMPFLIHVVTQDKQKPRITVTPEMRSKRSVYLANHHTGKKNSKNPHSSKPPHMTVEEVRESFLRILTAMGDEVPAANGCLLPIRVKLILADGEVVEQKACRGQWGWPRVASEVANEMMDEYMGI